MTGWALPDRLRSGVRSPDRAARIAAVEELGAVVDAGAEARAELERVAASDVPEVADVARRVLSGWRPSLPSPPSSSSPSAESPAGLAIVPATPPTSRSSPRIPAGVVTAHDARSRTFTRTKWREGYDPDEVDAYLAIVAQALDERWGFVKAGRRTGPSGLTPEDVVNKRFSSTKFREGYDQDEVDDYLDRIVNSLRTLDERLG